jgi:hypothetical protein
MKEIPTIFKSICLFNFQNFFQMEQVKRLFFFLFNPMFYTASANGATTSIRTIIAQMTRDRIRNTL